MAKKMRAHVKYIIAVKLWGQKPDYKELKNKQ